MRRAPPAGLCPSPDPAPAHAPPATPFCLQGALSRAINGASHVRAWCRPPRREPGALTPDPRHAVYDSEALWGYRQYFYRRGSAILSPRCLPQAVLGALIGLMPVMFHKDFNDIILDSSAYFSGITLVLGFLLVFRTQLAYDRYWEGRTTIQVMMSKLEDVAIHGKTFVRGTDRKIWQRELANLLLTYMIFVMADLRGMLDLDDIIERYALQMKSQQRHMLYTHHYRPYVVMGWIVEHWVKQSVKAGGIATSDPIQSRTYEILSEAQLAYNGAQKIQTTPFPFPLMQVCGMLLHVYMFSAPLVIGTFLRNWYLSPILSFFSVLGFFALNKTSEEMEDPFGIDPNDLPLEHFIKIFRFHLEALGLLDAADDFWKAQARAESGSKDPLVIQSATSKELAPPLKSVPDAAISVERSRTSFTGTPNQQVGGRPTITRATGRRASAAFRHFTIGANMMVMPQFEGEDSKTREASPGSREGQWGPNEGGRGREPSATSPHRTERRSVDTTSEMSPVIPMTTAGAGSERQESGRDVEDPSRHGHPAAAAATAAAAAATAAAGAELGSARQGAHEGVQLPGAPNSGRRNSIAWEDMKSAVRRMSVRTSIIRTMAAQEEMDLLKGASQFMVMD